MRVSGENARMLPLCGRDRRRLHLPPAALGYYAVSPTTVGTTRDHPPPWAQRGIAHHRAYYAASPTTVDTRPHTLKSEVPLSRIIFALYLSPLAMWAKGTMYQVDNPWCVRFW